MERKDLFIKDHVSRGDHTLCGDIVAAISSVIHGVADEDAKRGASVELMVHCCCEVGEAATPEHAKLVIC
jgi:hypothetical protein